MHDESPGLRVGVVGIGYWGSKHIRALRSIPRVAGVVGIDQRFDGVEPRARRIAADVVAFSSIDEAESSVDALVIATPPTSHAALGMRAIAAGKHVLIEKPLAASATEARRLVESADRAGVVLMAGHTFEYNAAVRKLRDLITSGELGRVYYLDCARLNLGLYQDDVNVIHDLAPHDISIANYVLGSQPDSVTAWGARHVHPVHEDHAYMRLDYGDPPVSVNIQVSWLSPVKVRRVTAVGSEKMVVYDDLAGDERIRIYDKSAIPPVAGDGPLSRVAYRFGDLVSPSIAFSEPLVVQDQHFVDCVLDGVRPASDGRSGLDVVKVLECAQVSLAQRRRVSMSELSAPASLVRSRGPRGDEPASRAGLSFN